MLENVNYVINLVHINTLVQWKMIQKDFIKQLKVIILITITNQSTMIKNKLLILKERKMIGSIDVVIVIVDQIITMIIYNNMTNK